MRGLSTIGIRGSVCLHHLLTVFFIFTVLLQAIGAEKVVRKSVYGRDSVAGRKSDINQHLDDSLVEKETQQQKQRHVKGQIIPPSSYQNSDDRRRSLSKDDIDERDGGAAKAAVESFIGDVPSPVDVGKSIATFARQAGVQVADQTEDLPSGYVDPFTGMTKSLADWKLEGYVITITIKGNMYATNRTNGKKLWNIVTDDLWSVEKYKGSSDDDEDQYEDDIEWVIEPGNGGTLYSHTLSGGLQRGRFHSIKYISENSPYSHPNGFTLTGSKDTEIFTINPITGEFLSSSNGRISNGLPDKCKKRTQLEGLDDDEDEECTVRKVSLARTDYTIKIGHPERGRLWTLKYTEWGIGTQNQGLADQYKNSLDGTYLHPLPNGNLIRKSQSDKYNLVTTFNEPVAQIFDVASNIHDKSLVLLPHPKDPDILKNDQGHRVLESIEGGNGLYVLPYSYSNKLQAQALPGRTAWKAMDREDRWNAIKGVRAISDFQSLKTVDSTAFDSNVSQNQQQYLGNSVARTVSSPSEKPLKDNAAFQITALLILMSLMWFAGRHSTDLSQAIRKFRQNLPSVQNGASRQILDINPTTPMIKETFTEDEIRPDRAPETLPVQVESEVKEVQVVLKEELPPQLAQEIKNDATPDDFVMVPLPQAVPPPKRTVQFAEDIKKPEQENGSDNEDNDADKGATATTPKKKRQRGSRGGKRGRGAKKKTETEADVEKSTPETEEKSEKSSGSDKGGGVIHNPTLLMSNANGQIADDLFVSNDVLGIGSHGTRVYKGKFGDREVAVKRLLVDSYDLASHEVNLLQRVDDHPNVVRYFCQKQTDLFLYIALELCPASLQDVFDESKHHHILELMDPPEVLRQMTLGVQHLHSLKIVHRDLKPQNILVAEPKRSLRNPSEIKHPKILISDFGLCKKLEADQSSFRATTAHAAGTSGWRAPELLIGEAGDTSISSISEHTNGSTSDSSVLDTLTNRRATRAIDIFSLGCVFYFVLTRGGHPFGERYLREGNIITGKYNLSGLEVLGDYGAEASDLIASMIARNPKARPDATSVLTHPFFWSADKKLTFLLDVSDRFEKEERDPPSPLLQRLESYAKPTFNNDWYKRLDKGLIDNLGKHRKYQGDRMLDLLRALRNKKHHYQDLPPAVQATVGALPDGYLTYFTSRFPSLLVNMYHLVRDDIREEPMWRSYFTA